ncbi:hypothetical protein K439DRAFT_1617812 [Ramaria rubella]|nr:hypothetical protein K439DRAFT_1617812 [Ramaria rubella]
MEQAVSVVNGPLPHASISAISADPIPFHHSYSFSSPVAFQGSRYLDSVTLLVNCHAHWSEMAIPDVSNFTASRLLSQLWLGVVLQASRFFFYALMRYTKVLIGLGSLGLVVTVFNFVSAYGGKHMACIVIISATAYASLVQFMVAAWLANIYLADSGIELVAEVIATSLRVAFEIIPIVLTIWRTANAFKRQKTRMLLEPANLESLILRSGRPPVLCDSFRRDIVIYSPALVLETLALISLFVSFTFTSLIVTDRCPCVSGSFFHVTSRIEGVSLPDHHPHETTTLSIFRVDPPSRALMNFGQEFGDEILGGYSHQ